MKFGSLDHFYTGVAIPVSSLRSDTSCGSGEFSDLILLGKWCKSVGIEIIQILPINDTGLNNSPYSAISALALHPIFIRLQELPEAAAFLPEIDQFRQTYENSPRLLYSEVLERKLDFLKRIFKKNSESIKNSEEVNKWIAENPWIKPYAVFFHFKKKYNFYHWKFWPIMQQPTESDIKTEWERNRDNSYFYAWIQYHLEKQLIEAAKALESMGINLKGDIPILMNEDSVDIWMYRKYFNLGQRAGAPPDMFSSLGQNWDFPVFNWETLREDDFWWWRLRLKQAQKFYHAYRIDHVLGFFRIYTIPTIENSGKMGYFNPSHFITKEDLNAAGFDKGRIRWMSYPHIPGEEVDFLIDDKSEFVKETYLHQINHENLYNLQSEYDSEKVIESLDEDQKIKSLLLGWHRNRTLLEIEPGIYHHRWDYEETRAFKSLNYTEQQNLKILFKEIEEKSEKIWEKQGDELLSMMKDTTDMLMCAEDLGVVPKCVPKVLKKHHILSLKIQRWTKEYDKPGHPFISVKKYPLLSVCTPSVHDTSTLRGWWEAELTEEERQQYFSGLSLKTTCPEDYSLPLAKAIIEKILSSHSLFTIFQLQDFFSLLRELRISNPTDERINVPGTVSDKNWSYRIHTTLEFLMSFEKFNDLLMKLIIKRRTKTVPMEHL
ncbi:MAG: 4-alpha-glucanotransferase [Spirochaetales bacterium]|nr:4-alpha-glucanotransferase [Spirochaetales bacterium]